MRTTVGVIIGLAVVAVMSPSLSKDVYPTTPTPIVQRAMLLRDGFTKAERYYADVVRPVERVIYERTGDAKLSKRIAIAVVREANRNDLPIPLALGILMVENPDFNPRARSHVGATGLAQVMPFHAGRWAPCGSNLEDVEDNICTGMKIFAANLREANGNVDRALLAYNGCVNGTNTPDCHQYPNWVMNRLGRASLALWREQQ